VSPRQECSKIAMSKPIGSEHKSGKNSLTRGKRETMKSTQKLLNTGPRGRGAHNLRMVTVPVRKKKGRVSYRKKKGLTRKKKIHYEKKGKRRKGGDDTRGLPSLQEGVAPRLESRHGHSKAPPPDKEEMSKGGSLRENKGPDAQTDVTSRRRARRNDIGGKNGSPQVRSTSARKQPGPVDVDLPGAT